GRQDQVGPVLVGRVPERSHLGGAAVGVVGDEAGLVPVGQRALRGMGGEVGPQPLLLLRALAAADVVAVGIEDDNVPGARVVAVPALPLRPGGGPEVVEVGGGAGREVLVVADRRAGPALETAPGRPVAAGELPGRPRLVGVVAEGEHRAAGGGDQGGGGGVARNRAAGDVTRPHQDGIGG